jgi:DNA polymerase-4
MGRGVGGTEVTDEPWRRRSLSHQTTFPQDLTDRTDVERELRLLADRVCADVVAEGRWVAKVAIIVRYPSFFTRTRVTKLAEPTQDAALVADTAVGLLERVTVDRPIRLLGVRADLTLTP